MLRNRLNQVNLKQNRKQLQMHRGLNGTIFIHRPIFAWVIALVIMLAGILTLTKCLCTISTIAPPTVTIAATYPGASAETVENTADH